MEKKLNVVVIGDSTFAWAMVSALRKKISGHLYFLLPERDQAVEASLLENVIAINGNPSDPEVLDQLDLENCHTFIAGSREDDTNVLCALYARNKGAKNIYARVFETRFTALFESVGITPIQTSETAAAFLSIRILKPDVADLVDLAQGQFDLDEIDVARVPELVGCHLGNLQSDYLNTIAIAKDGKTHLGYKTLVEKGSKVLVIYERSLGKEVLKELRRVALIAKDHASQSDRDNWPARES
ncbi:MAG: TrkA family potassium uptake protein [Chloroflexi bacterium]|nr:TrkA family potassium uptake protein [Chloroflexota bacterium]